VRAFQLPDQAPDMGAFFFPAPSFGPYFTADVCSFVAFSLLSVQKLTQIRYVWPCRSVPGRNLWQHVPRVGKPEVQQGTGTEQGEVCD